MPKPTTKQLATKLPGYLMAAGQTATAAMQWIAQYELAIEYKPASNRNNVLFTAAQPLIDRLDAFADGYRMASGNYCE